MSEALSAYSGPDVRCTKCGYVGAETNYVAALKGLGFERGELTGPIDRPECLERVCGRCGFIWLEATVDRLVLGGAPE